MEFVSRVKELESVLALVRDDKGRSIALVGPRGCGKTAILDAVSKINDLPIAVVRGNLMETSWPLSGVSAFLSAVDAALGVTLVAQIHEDPVLPSPFELSRRVDTLLREARLGRFVVLMDDVDSLDELSQQVLGYVIRRMTPAGMSTVLATQAVTFDGPFSGIPKMVLGPVDVGTLIKLGESIAPPTVSYSVLDYVARGSAGSPLAFKSILSEVPANVLEGEAPLPLPMRPGKKLATLVTARLDRLSEDARQALGWISCCAYLPEAVYRELPAVTLEALADLIAQDVVARVAGNLQIKDPTVGATAYWSLSSSNRLALHTDLARACEDKYPGLRAWHASFVQLPGELPAVLLREASMLVRQGNVRAGVEFAERARELGGVLDVEAASARLVKSFILSAEYDFARRYLQISRGQFKGHVVPPEFASYYVILDYVQHQVFSARSVAATVGAYRGTDPDGCGRLLCISALCLLEKWELESARSLVEEASQLAGTEMPMVGAVTEAVRLYSWAIAGKELPELADLEASGDILRQGFGPETSAILLAQALSLGERYADARELLNNIVDQAGRLSRIWIDYALQVQFANEYRVGRYHRARAVFEVIDAGGAQRRSFGVNRQLMAAAFATLDGDAPAATESVRRGMRMVAIGKCPAQEGLLAVRQGRISMMSNDFETAVGHFARARRVGRNLVGPQLLRFHGDYAESLMLMGQSELAREVVEDLRGAARRTPSRWATLTLLRCDAQLLEGEESIRAFSELLELWNDGDYEYLRGRAFLSYAKRLEELGYEKLGADARREGLNVFHEIGVGAKIEACVGGLPSGEPATPLEDLLDHKELPVVRLLARGYKNQSIAHELFLSVRTVELRLTGVYRKFGVKSRFELLKLVAGAFKDE